MRFEDPDTKGQNSSLANGAIQLGVETSRVGDDEVRDFPALGQAEGGPHTNGRKDSVGFEAVEKSSASLGGLGKDAQGWRRSDLTGSSGADACGSGHPGRTSLLHRARQ